MKVLIACEESQAVCIEFRKLGHEAYSCDIQECSGGHPEWHLQQDVTEVLKQEWDMIIAFPPCTYLSYAANHVWNKPGRAEKRKDGHDFFMMFVNHPCKRIAIENPVGYMNTVYRKPDQIIQPYYFGDDEIKTTCLWLKGLPTLQHENPRLLIKPTPKRISPNGKKIHFTEGVNINRASVRSKTFPGIARAMATQWGDPEYKPKQISINELSPR